jgi:trehalose 6-phosphate synthase
MQMQKVTVAPQFVEGVRKQPIHASRLIIASNRGPVEYVLSRDNKLRRRRGAGGLVTALIDAVKNMEVTWVAMAMTEGDRVALKEAQNNGSLLSSPLSGQQMQLRYVNISKAAYRKFYEKISNQLLWFLQHYMYDLTENAASKRVQDAWINGYCVANQAFADAVNKEIDREDGSVVVMLHDYHLYLASAMIRKRHPSAVIQQFIHIPWPDIRCWHFLPSNITNAIFSGLVGNDIIGFQTERDARNFLEGARTVLDGAEVDFAKEMICWRGHCTRVHAYPISISVSGERRALRSRPGKRAAEEIQPLLREKTIMRVDRIEPTKNIVRGFQAYGQMLDEHPELLGKVTFLAFLVPCRQALPVYQRYNADVLKSIAEINQKYGTDEWQPIQAFFGNDRTRALAAMQYYDVLLVNPIIDGMNLVAKEGPVVNQRNGLLVLSRTVGAFQQLGKFSIPTSPTDTTETAQALYKALTLPPEERRIKAVLARQAVENQDLNGWLAKQIHDLNEILDDSSPRPTGIDESYDELGPYLLAGTA